MNNEEPNRQRKSLAAVVTFISQCTAAGVLAACFVVIDALINSLTNEVYLSIFLFPFLTALIMPVLLVIGGFLWCAAAARNHSPKLLGRLVISLPIAYVIGLILEAGGYTEWFHRPIEFAICFGLPTAFFVRSSIRPWKVFTFGTVSIKSGRKTSRRTSSNLLALIGSLPLRLLSIYLCLLSILIEATVAREAYGDFAWHKPWSIGIGIALMVNCYFISGIYLSYRTPPINVLVSLAIFINAPTFGLAVWLYSKRNHELDGWFFLAAAAVVTVYLMHWVLCIASRIAAAKIIQRQIQRKQFAVMNEHHCLGERLNFWQQEHAVGFGGTK